MTGHTKDKCYCIHGFPSWNKLFGKPKPRLNSSSVGNVKAISAANVSSAEIDQDKYTSICNVLKRTSSSETITLTDDHCKQLIQPRQRSMNSCASAASSATGGSNVQSND